MNQNLPAVGLIGSQVKYFVSDSKYLLALIKSHSYLGRQDDEILLFNYPSR
jgi:hypothetical protein